MINTSQRNRVTLLDIIALLCIYFAASATMSASLLHISLFVAIPCAFIICGLSYDTIRNNVYIRILLCLYLWLGFCTPLAEILAPAIDELQRVLGCFILSYSMASLATKPKMIPWLYLSYCILLLFVWKYANDNIMNDITFGEERLGDDRLNANHLAYYSFYVMFCIYILGDIIIEKKIRLFFQILFLTTILFSFITGIYTASRQVLYIQVPFYFLLLCHRYFIQSKISINSRIILIVSGILAFILLYNIYGKDIYTNSLLKERSQIGYQDDIRSDITQNSLIVGFNHPILGHGPGNGIYFNRKVIAHNTFLELFLNSGIPGVLIFLYLIYKFIKLQFIRWKRNRDKNYLLFLIFGLFWFIYQVLYVFYTDLWLISFFILVATHSEIYYKNKQLISH